MRSPGKAAALRKQQEYRGWTTKLGVTGLRAERQERGRAVYTVNFSANI